MSYTAMYRKFRPQRFEDVKGQDHIVTTLENQIKSGRIGHAYLFCGTRGTGKTSVAKLFAKAINCEHPDGINPCLECSSCKAIQSGSSMNVFEIDAASNNGVDNIRQIVEEVQYPPTEGRYKVYIIDEVHMLSIGAFNALLKTLEEPPEYVVFILATTEVHKLPVTILSRCQRYDFKRIGTKDIINRIKELLSIEGLSAEDDAIEYIAKAADGAMRDALSLLDQCLAFNFGKTLTYEMVLDVLGAVDSDTYSNLLRTIVSEDVGRTIKILEEAIMNGRELSQFVVDFTWYLRNLMLAKTSDDLSMISDMSKEGIRHLKEEANLIPLENIIRYIRIFSELTNQIRYSTNKRILVEIALVKLCCPAMESREDSIVPRIISIEKKLEKGVSFAHKNEEQAVVKEPAAPKVEAPLPKAIPEDIKRVVQDWNKIIDRLDIANASFLRGTKTSLGAGGELMIVFENATKFNFFAGIGEATKEHSEERVENLKRIIADVTGKTVEVKLELAKDEQHFHEDYYDIKGLFAGIEGLELEVEPE